MFFDNKANGESLWSDRSYMACDYKSADNDDDVDDDDEKGEKFFSLDGLARHVMVFKNRFNFIGQIYIKV